MGHMPMMGGQHMGMMRDIPMMGGRHMGMIGHMPMLGGCHGGIAGLTGDLGLNSQQQQKANDIKFELRKKHWEIMGRMIDQQAALQNAYASERPDPKTVGGVYSQIFELKRQMIEVALEASNKLMDILTEDQRNQVRKMHQGHSGMMQGQGMMDHCAPKTN
jgi:hypothetical protein